MFVRGRPRKTRQSPVPSSSDEDIPQKKVTPTRKRTISKRDSSSSDSDVSHGFSPMRRRASYRNVSAMFLRNQFFSLKRLAQRVFVDIAGFGQGFEQAEPFGVQEKIKA